MTRHTPETVRAALERAGLTVTLGPLLYPNPDPPFTWSFARGPRDFVSEDRAGALWVYGLQIHPPDRYHPNDLRAEQMTEDEAWWIEHGATVVRVRGLDLGTIADYRSAPGGEGPMAATWADKPHRLVYDLARCVGEQEERVRVLREALISTTEIIDEDAYPTVTGKVRAALAATEEK